MVEILKTWLELHEGSNESLFVDSELDTYVVEHEENFALSIGRSCQRSGSTGLTEERCGARCEERRLKSRADKTRSARAEKYHDE